MPLDGCPKQCEAQSLPFIRIAEREVSLGSYYEDATGMGVGGMAVVHADSNAWADRVKFGERQ